MEQFASFRFTFFFLRESHPIANRNKNTFRYKLKSLCWCLSMNEKRSNGVESSSFPVHFFVLLLEQHSISSALIVAREEIVKVFFFFPCAKFEGNISCLIFFWRQVFTSFVGRIVLLTLFNFECNIL